MLSPLRANHLARCLPRLSLNCSTRSFASTSREHGLPPKSVKDASIEAYVPLFAAAAQPENHHSLDIDTALNHYSSLPPLPPSDDWLSHFYSGTSQLRDRISIRAPASAISVARSFVNSKKTSTNNPKVIVEAFPGVHCPKTVVTLLSCPV